MRYTYVIFYLAVKVSMKGFIYLLNHMIDIYIYIYAHTRTYTHSTKKMSIKKTTIELTHM